MINFDPRSPEFRANPYPFYELLRTNAPIFYWDEWEMWFLTRHADCTALLRDNRLGNTPTPGNSMLFQNPPDHTRLRSLVHKGFTPRMIERFRSEIQAMTDELLDAVEAQGSMDVVADLAYPLPVKVIAGLMGVPAEDHVKFHQWSKDLVQTLDLARDPAIDERAADAEAAFDEYFEHLFALRRSDPQDDLLSALVAVEEEGDRLSEVELQTTSRLLLIAGFETTVGLISNGALALMQNPAQRELLAQEPGLIQPAIEEFLRFDSPIQMVGRTALEDIAYGDHLFPAGASVSMMIGAANHDPDVYTDPSRLDIARQPNPHLSFSSGIHYCLGAPLARLEGQIALQTLFRRLPKLALANPNPVYRDNYVFRGVEALPVAF